MTEPSEEVKAVVRELLFPRNFYPTAYADWMHKQADKWIAFVAERERLAQARAITQCAIEAGERSPEGISSHSMLGDMWDERIRALETKDEMSKSTITAQDIFLALIAELDHPQGYITKDPMSLDSVTVDGVISCEAVSEYLNQKLAQERRP